jgi:hypothetical protein
LRFPNCLAYRNKFEFAANLQWALTHPPTPLTPELQREFTWEAATDRFIFAASISRKEALEREKLGMSKVDERIAWFHNELGKGPKGDVLRKVFGAGPASEQVKYQMRATTSQRQAQDGTTDYDEDEGLEGGLSRKFQQSSFVKAIREATANAWPSFLTTP